MATRDAVVVGSGPNGLSAAALLAGAGRSVLVLEAQDEVGGGMRTAELAAPGFRSDVCASALPLAVLSPYLRTLPLARHGLELLQPPAPLAHPLDDGTAVVLERSLAHTVEGLGADGPAYRRLFGPMVRDLPHVAEEILAAPHVPRHPRSLLRFAGAGARSATGLARRRFREVRAAALFAGCAAHSGIPLERVPSAAFGVVLAASGHAAGWPVARGGTGELARALAAEVRDRGGEIETGRRVESLADVPPARVILFDVAAEALAAIAGDALPAWYRAILRRQRRGGAIFEVDLALRGPLPWRAEACRRAGTVHLGGTIEEVAASERAIAGGSASERPFVILVQPGVVDPMRAPAGCHAAWAYCHVPHASDEDRTDVILDQIERFAPGARGQIVASRSWAPADLEAENANIVGGDINGGANDLLGLLTRPVPRWTPYATPHPRLFLCSASTPPGGGVHGMCGYHAARAALRRLGPVRRRSAAGRARWRPC